jgi:hypothetical protein
MGLAEKRLAEEIKTEKLPAFEAKLKDRAGYEIKVDIDWATFTAYDQYPLSRLDSVFSELDSFVRKICVDDMGKEALKEKMNVIGLTNTDNTELVSMDLKDNKLALVVQLAGNSYNFQSDSQLVSYVEKLL